MPTIQLPNNWSPRDYQMPLWRYLENGGKRANYFWHRRAGKDDVPLNWTAVDAVQHPGTYWYLLPEAAQARKAIWEAINPHTGIRRIDQAFPQEMRLTTRENEMMIKLPSNGGQSTWQVVGSDNFNSLMGSPPRGVVFSEWPLANPAAWAYIRPILAENGGWAIFEGTPRGKNHAHTMYQRAKNDPEWFTQLLTVDDTNVFTKDTLQRERFELIAEYGQDQGLSIFEQEYYCSFEAAIIGAFYAREMRDAEKEGRITAVPWDPAYPVDTAWDLGLDQQLAVWFCQTIGYQHRFIRFESGIGGMAEMIKRLREFPYQYGRHYGPHDLAARDIGSGIRRIDMARQLGIEFTAVEKLSPEDGINRVQGVLAKSVFDETNASHGVSALKSYRRKWDDEKKTFLPHAVHDWASHPADAMRYFAVGYERPEEIWIDYAAIKRASSGGDDAGW